jgi:hypothetical protein
LSFLFAYVFSSTKLEIRTEQVLPGSEGEVGARLGERGRGRNDPNNVYIYELMNNKKIK